MPPPPLPLAGPSSMFTFAVNPAHIEASTSTSVIHGNLRSAAASFSVNPPALPPLASASASAFHVSHLSAPTFTPSSLNFHNYAPVPVSFNYL
jgi:hypothetical protein